MKILKTFKNIDLIEVSEDNYCVRKRYKNWLGKDKVTYFCLYINGTTYTHDTIAASITLGDLESALLVFNANSVQLGAL